ncbi:MAG: DUF2924 domain-containing protein [Candidatus Omnitrophica bacterium]|nr:DUF2924 domain-containing protein [Candidatus Omnitrophota bacterium]
MVRDIADEITSLRNQPLEALAARYKEVFGVNDAPSSNKVFLWRKIAYRLQEQEFGSLSPKAKDRLAFLIEQYDPINNKALRPTVTSTEKETAALPSLRDKRLPIPGTIIRKNYKGQEIRVKVLEKGFEYNGKVYRTLTAIAQELTGAHWNGYSFFNL